MTGVISLGLLQALEVDPTPLDIPAPPRPMERLDAGPAILLRRSVWSALATLLLRTAA